MTVIAHAGHWIEGGIFAAPVIIVAAALAISSVREKRRLRREAGSGDERGRRT